MGVPYANNSLLTVYDTRMIAYADKMANDKFDGTQGFSIDGGIKDARYWVLAGHRAKTLLSGIHLQPHPAAHVGTQLTYARH